MMWGSFRSHYRRIWYVFHGEKTLSFEYTRDIYPEFGLGFTADRIYGVRVYLTLFSRSFDLRIELKEWE